MAYFRPVSLSESLELLAENDLTIVAGATDLYPAQANGQAWGKRHQVSHLDISGLQDLSGISDAGDHYRIGALATWSDLSRQSLPDYFRCLKQAALTIGGQQIQNRATLVGNLCNASPAADGVPGLLCLNAEVELVSRSAQRTLPLGEFILANRKTAIRADELVSALRVPKLPDRTRSGFEKLGSRRYLVISIVMAAAAIVVDDGGRIQDPRIAIGSCSPVARRLTALEAKLRGMHSTGNLDEVLTVTDLDALEPIDDIRSDSTHRRRSALELVRRLLANLGDPSGSR